MERCINSWRRDLLYRYSKRLALYRESKSYVL
nr:MAG TPA_asm: hypothetical protein [Bacteriophage sp.]DAP05616.1 MAG TPA: hypothetical protein [Caudoviricetes sp.]